MTSKKIQVLNSKIQNSRGGRKRKKTLRDLLERSNLAIKLFGYISVETTKFRPLKLRFNKYQESLIFLKTARAYLYWQVKLKLLQIDYQTQRIVLREYLWPYKALQLLLDKPK